MFESILLFFKELVLGEKKNRLLSLIILIVLIAILGQPLLKRIYANASDIESQSNALETLTNIKDKVINDPQLYEEWSKILQKLDESLDNDRYAIINVGNAKVNNTITNKYIQLSISLIMPLIVLISSIFAKQKNIWVKIIAIIICLLYLIFVGYISIVVPKIINEVITGIIILIIQISLIVMVYRKLQKK